MATFQDPGNQSCSYRRLNYHNDLPQDGDFYLAAKFLVEVKASF